MLLLFGVIVCFIVVWCYCIVFFFIFFFYRIILVVFYFNYNFKRGSKVDVDGEFVLYVIYFKFKEGEVIVKEVKVCSNYGIY